MEQVANYVVRPIGSGFEYVGLTSPVMRIAFVTAAVGGSLILMKPDMFYTDGIAKQWTFLREENVPIEHTTAVPWYLASGIAGLAAGLLF